MTKYFFAFTSSIMSMLGMFIIMGLFSRFWPISDFLEFAADIRSAGFLIAIGSFSLGFAIINRAQIDSLKQVIYPAAFWSILLFAGLTSALWCAFYGRGWPMLVWVVAGSVFHVYVSTLRVDGGTYASLITILCKFVFIILCALATLSGSYQEKKFFILYGGLLLTWILYDSHRLGLSLRVSECFYSTAFSLFKKNWTRALDNIVRAGFHILPVWLAGYHIGTEASGLMALTLLSVKAIESALQPVIMQIHVSQSKSRQIITLNTVILVFLSASILTILVYIIIIKMGSLIIVFWLGYEYKPVLALVLISVWSLPFIISLQIYKGLFESAAGTSPFFLSNSIALFLMALSGFYFDVTLSDITLIYVVSNMIRFFGLIPLKVRENIK